MAGRTGHAGSLEEALLGAKGGGGWCNGRTKKFAAGPGQGGGQEVEGVRQNKQEGKEEEETVEGTSTEFKQELSKQKTPFVCLNGITIYYIFFYWLFSPLPGV